MDEYEYEYEYNEPAIHEGFEDLREGTNRLNPGTEDRLRAEKSLATRHEQELKDIELSEKIRDMSERREIEREKLEFEREKAQLEAIDRAAQAKAESKRFKWQCGLSGLALIGTIIFTWVGWETDKPDSERIRNGARERDRNKLFEFGERALGKIGK